jgi:protein-S-isoprenylcysteine O-methyltransferase Ste14
VDALELKIPPAVTTVLAAALMWLAARAVPALAVPIPGLPLVAGALASIGLALILAGWIAFHGAGTTVDPMRPHTATSFVRTGVYRFTRNPMYAGAFLLLAAWGVLLANAVALVPLPLFFLYMNRFQIVPEERALRAKFGAEYAAYARSVRRWL